MQSLKTMKSEVKVFSIKNERNQVLAQGHYSAEEAWKDALGEQPAIFRNFLERNFDHFPKKISFRNKDEGNTEILSLVETTIEVSYD